MRKLSTRLDPAILCASVVPTNAPVAAWLKCTLSVSPPVFPCSIQRHTRPASAHASNFYRRLHNQVVRVFALRRIPRRNQHHARDKAPMLIHNS